MTDCNQLPGIYIEVAYQSNAFFTGTNKGDICIRGTHSSQQMMFGVVSNSDPLYGFNDSNMFIKGRSVLEDILHNL